MSAILLWRSISTASLQELEALGLACSNCIGDTFGIADRSLECIEPLPSSVAGPEPIPSASQLVQRAQEQLKYRSHCDSG